MIISEHEYDLNVAFKNGRNSHFHSSNTKEELLASLEKWKSFKSNNPKVIRQQSMMSIVVKALKA
jgi:hypothetical protein